MVSLGLGLVLVRTIIHLGLWFRPRTCARNSCLFFLLSPFTQDGYGRYLDSRLMCSRTAENFLGCSRRGSVL